MVNKILMGKFKDNIFSIGTLVVNFSKNENTTQACISERIFTFCWQKWDPRDTILRTSLKAHEMKYKEKQA